MIRKNPNGDYPNIDDTAYIDPSAVIIGKVKIGKNVWIGPNCSIIDHIQIGDNVFVGIGAVVTKSLPKCVVAFGNPARIIRENKTN